MSSRSFVSLSSFSFFFPTGHTGRQCRTKPVVVIIAKPETVAVVSIVKRPNLPWHLALPWQRIQRLGIPAMRLSIHVQFISDLILDGAHPYMPRCREPFIGG